ncbi:hypothetical protein DW757_11460 [Clostridium sp. AM29-11AC]|uniref:hypothetical protein n=1 Tax=Clostridium sp. AM29-11AC TaxID=2293028 RepID=UPI000E4F87D5|nr:hypothetical protein [Clostridium sp. AM29-11AC]RHT55964.1 hypothetical protein DW757_11460 [Clostridium sp. AM29-11AC]
MLHVQVQKKKRGFAGYLLSFLIFFAILFFSLFCMNAMQRRSEEESLMSLRDAIRRASVQCYAIEGRYPPSVEYLEEHYGIVIDRDRYHVFYDGWASNVMPDITVLPVAEEEKGDETW